jgi:hypothetical protein
MAAWATSTSSRARDFLLRAGAECRLDLTAALEGWHRRGPFMHTINHPRIIACAGIAHLAAARLGLVDPAGPPPELPFDPLAADTIWPVYPEIAEELDVPGSLLFTGSLLFKRITRPIEPLGNRTWLPLPDFIRESFAMYRAYPADAFSGGEVARARDVLATLLG